MILSTGIRSGAPPEGIALPMAKGPLAIVMRGNAPLPGLKSAQ